MNQSPILQNFINQSQDSIWIVNHDFKLIYANKKHFKLGKLLFNDKYKLNSSVFVEGLDHKTIEKWKAFYNRGFQGEYFEIEEQYHNPDLNETKYGQTTFEPVLDDDQTIVGVACRWKDITSTVKKRSQSHQLMAASLDVFCTFNGKGEFVYVSDAALNHWGYAPHELIGKPYINLTLEEDIPKTLEVADAILNGQDFISFYNRYKKKNGEIAYNSWSARWDKSSKLTFCVVRDNKKVIEHEKQLLLSEQRFKALVQEGSDLTGILNAEGNYVYLSPTNNAANSDAAENIIGKNALNFIHPDDLERLKNNFEQLRSQKRVHVEPFRYKNHDNEWRWKETVLTNLLDHPAVNGIVMNSRDITDKIRQEEKIKQSKARFKALVQEGSDLISILDKEGIFKYISPSCKTVLGIEPAKFINKNPLNFVHPDDRQRVQSSLENISTKNKVIVDPFRFQNHDKEWRWMETIFTNMLDNPAVKGIVANSRDITEAKKLKELNDQVSEIAKIGSWEIDLVKNHLFWSEEVHKLHGTNPKTYEPNVESWIHFFREDFRKLVETKLNNSIATGNPFNFEAIIITANNKECWVRSVGNTEIINNQCLRVYGSFQDIHKQKIADLELGKSLKALEDYKFSLDQSAIIAFTDENGIITYANDYFCEISGYAREELIGNTHKLINANYHPKPFFEDFWKTISSGNVWRGEVQNKAKNGAYYWVDTTIVPFLDDTNTPIKYLAIRFDITERKKAVANLAHIKERLDLATTSAKMGIWDWDVINGTLSWDDKMHELYGTNKKDFDGHYTSWSNGLHPDDIDETTAALEKALAGEQDFNTVFRVVWPDKSVHYIEAHGIVSRDEAGNAVRVIGGNVDITKRKIDEEEKNYLQSTLENSLNEIYIFDEQTFKFSYANKGALLNLGYSQDEIRTFTPIDIKPEITEASFRALVHPLVAHKKNKLIFFTNHQRKDGSVYPVEIHLQLISESYNKRFLAVVLDITERKKAEEAIVAALDEKDTILESIGDGFFTVDSNWIITYWNKKAELIMGKTKAQVVGKHLWEEYSDAIDTKFYRDYNKAMSKRESMIVEDYYQGIGVWLEASVYPAKEGGIAIYFRNITERKQKEAERYRLQEALENSLNEIYIFDADTYKFNYVNKGALQNLGYTKDTIETLTPFDIVCDLTESSFNQMVTPLITNEKEKIVIFANHKRKDGSIYPVEAHAQLVREGNTNRYLTIILDRTELQKAEEEDKFKANLLSMISQAIIATDLDGTVNYWNNAAETIYGWSKEEAKGKNIVDLVPSQASKEEASEIMELLKKGQTWSGEFQVKNKNGTLFPIFCSNSPVYDEHNTLSGMLGISSDISEDVKNKELLRQHTLELERSNQDLEQFAFIASHDLQEPLRMIHSFMDLLKQKYGHKIDPKGHEYIYFAIDGAKRMRQIILDLLEFSRANNPEEDYQKEKVALKTVLSDYKNLRKNLILSKKVTISCNTMPTLFTYKAVIDQIFHCLLDNAIKFSKSGTPPIIDITGKEQETEWEFAIRDNGIGINQQHYDKIFGIFQRLNGKDSYSGTGIGLAVTKRHIEFLGGRIWLESEMGEGTVFYFTIPK